MDLLSPSVVQLISTVGLCLGLFGANATMKKMITSRRHYPASIGGDVKRVPIYHSLFRTPTAVLKNPMLGQVWLGLFVTIAVASLSILLSRQYTVWRQNRSRQKMLQMMNPVHLLGKELLTTFVALGTSALLLLANLEQVALTMKNVPALSSIAHYILEEAESNEILEDDIETDQDLELQYEENASVEAILITLGLMSVAGLMLSFGWRGFKAATKKVEDSVREDQNQEAVAGDQSL